MRVEAVWGTSVEVVLCERSHQPCSTEHQTQGVYDGTLADSVGANQNGVFSEIQTGLSDATKASDTSQGEELQSVLSLFAERVLSQLNLPSGHRPISRQATRLFTQRLHEPTGPPEVSRKCPL